MDTRPIIAFDDQLPGAADLLSPIGAPRPFSVTSVSNDMLHDASALLVRSDLRVNADLLAGTAVRFVASATSGSDHFDRDFLTSSGIKFAAAPGSNAPAVCDYVLTALFKLAALDLIRPFDATIGIIGCGNVGSRLRSRLSNLGIRVLTNDPPLEESGVNDFAWTPLPALLEQSDLITLHAPLTTTGDHATLNLIGADELARLRNGAVVVNSSRGRIVDETALGSEIAAGRLLAVIDTWVGEPEAECSLVRQATLATPHIAGYAVESKSRAVSRACSELARWLGTAPIEPLGGVGGSGTGSSLPVIPRPTQSITEFCGALTAQAYDIGRDHLRMQSMCSFDPSRRADFFRELRSGYRLRNEFSSFAVDSSNLSERQKQLVSGLGMELSQDPSRRS